MGLGRCINSYAVRLCRWQSSHLCELQEAAGVWMMRCHRPCLPGCLLAAANMRLAGVNSVGMSAARNSQANSPFVEIVTTIQTGIPTN